MRKFLMSFATLAVSAVMLSGCISDTVLYQKNLGGRFNNQDFAFLKTKYPMVLDAKGVATDKLRGDLINVMTEEYTNHNKFHNAELVSALSFDAEREITFIIEANANPKNTARNTCTSDTPHIKEGADLSTITTAHVAFCRKDEAWTYISINFKQPVAAESEEFRKAIRNAANSILYRKINPFTGCGHLPTDC